MKISQEPKYDAVVTVDEQGVAMREAGGWRTRLVNRATGVAIPDDEPIFIFRAKDKLALDALELYADLVAQNSVDGMHLAIVKKRIADFHYFRATHPNLIRMPNTDPFILRHLGVAT